MFPHRNQATACFVRLCNKGGIGRPFIRRIGGAFHTNVALLPKYPLQDIVAKHRNLGPGAPVVVVAKVYWCRCKYRGEVVESFRVCTDPTKDTLLRIGEGMQRNVFSELPYDTSPALRSCPEIHQG